MKLSWLKWSLIGLGLATVGVAGAIYTPFLHSEKATSNNAETTAFASVWDENIQPFTGTSELTVYRSPDCGCCGEWIKHMERHGFQIREDIKTDDMKAITAEYGVPQDVSSCHTAVIDGYVLEGHIPADDVKALLANQPDIAGIAVPGMPLGSPGMESGENKQDFAVMAFHENGDVEVYQEHHSY